MHLVPEDLRRSISTPWGSTVRVSPDEGIWTESCYKFSRASAESMLEEAGLRLASWHVDPDNYFALAVAAAA